MEATNFGGNNECLIDDLTALEWRYSFVETDFRNAKCSAGDVILVKPTVDRQALIDDSS